MTKHAPPIATRLSLLALASTLSLAPGTLHAQSPTLNRNLIVLDPAHGGTDTGAHLGEALEKDLDLAVSARLRTLLAAANFSVLTTRETDPPAAPLTPDQRANIANHARPLACITIHATASGSGVHLATSALTTSDSDSDDSEPNAPVPWNTAQAAYSTLSRRLANELGLALIHANVPTLLSHTSLRPIDSLTCPAVTLELAPLKNGSDTTPVTDAAYQQNVAQAVAAALVSWRTRNDPNPHPEPASPRPAPKPAPPKTATAPAATPTPAAEPAKPKPEAPKPEPAAPKSDPAKPEPPKTEAPR